MLAPARHKSVRTPLPKTCQNSPPKQIEQSLTIHFKDILITTLECSRRTHTEWAVSCQLFLQVPISSRRERIWPAITNSTFLFVSSRSIHSHCFWGDRCLHEAKRAVRRFLELLKTLCKDCLTPAVTASLMHINNNMYVWLSKWFRAELESCSKFVADVSNR